MLRNLLAKRRLLSEAEIHIYTPESYPLMEMGPAISEFTLRQILQQKIIVHYESQFQKVWDSEKAFRRRLQFRAGEVKCDLLTYVPPAQGSAVIQNSGLGDAQGWIRADPHHLTTAYPDIFAMGDAADIRLPNGKSLIKCGAVGTIQSYVVGKNVMAVVKGEEPKQSYGGWTIFVPEIGKGRAVTAIGKLYSKGPPRFWITPISRIWRLNKRLVEYVWKNRVKLPI
ncbi:MAG TPA: hypothetical protein VHY08_28205 [Bacillota bacterium]|nr:hypothetical protein [Bacillota bacterium]